MTRYLETIGSPHDLRRIPIGDLDKLAGEIRDRIIDVTSRKGGHLAASLGAVELAISLHYALKTPRDKLLWDVGHQAYAHKILTGRNERFDTLRELGGLSGFPNKDESEYDVMTAGHSSTSISAALGLACARDRMGTDEVIAAVIGDAALATGLAFEGLNHAGHLAKKLIVVLNDNEHSISKPVGALSRYLNSVIANPLYNRVREETQRMIKAVPKLGDPALKAVRKLEESLKNLIVPGILFEELGFRYFGPVDGHDIRGLVKLFGNLKSVENPVLVHVITKKGKGFEHAEENPVSYHGVNRFDKCSGQALDRPSGMSFTEHFGCKIADLAQKREELVAVTAAMPDGTGLSKFSEMYPDRVFDVGITEGHAVTFAGGLAKGGLKPVVAIYSTFLQRSFDQLVHDIALQGLAPIFAVDRAGLVGEDGPTHHGVFDICYMRALPEFIVAAPKDGAELEEMLEKALDWDRPVAIRYPRGRSETVDHGEERKGVQLGRAELLREGNDAVILALGSMVTSAFKAALDLSSKGIEVEVVNARFVKPLDGEMLQRVARKKCKIFTVEEGVLDGGFGEAVLDFFQQENLYDVKIKCIGLPGHFIEHGAREDLLRKYHLDAEGLAMMVENELKVR